MLRLPENFPAPSKSGWAAIVMTIVAGFEGLSLVAYQDRLAPGVFDVPTICYGHIEDVKIGDHKTKDQCDALLGTDLAKYNTEMMKCVKVALPDKRHAALLSFSYNVGISAFCNSTLARKLNAGDVKGACAELLRWTKAGGREQGGLVKRRRAENELCLDGA